MRMVIVLNLLEKKIKEFSSLSIFLFALGGIFLMINSSITKVIKSENL